jgi:hypothetical protein
MRSHHSGHRASSIASRLGTWSSLAILLGTVALLGIVTYRVAGEGKPFSAIDETVHADTAFKVHHGNYPFRGDKINQETVDTWSCYTGHAYVDWTARCHSKQSRPNLIPSGSYTTGYIHYPTYFLGGEVFRQIHDRVLGAPRYEIDSYRQYAAVVTLLGVVACAAMAWLIGLRGSSLLAAALTPVAAGGILVFATMVNPMSMAPLCGALVAGTGIRWMTTGRGFWWLAAATAFAAGVAVTSSLPGGVFLIACLIGLVARWRGHEFTGGWIPRWWHAGVLAAILVVPIVVFSLWTSSRATMTNDEIYAGYVLADWSKVLLGVWGEVFSLHDPWSDDSELIPASLSLPRAYARNAGISLPLPITVAVLGGLLAGAAGAAGTVLRRTSGNRPALDDDAPADDTVVEAPAPRRAASPLRLLSVSALLGFLLYPPLLRLSNAVNVGIDHPIVSRYSISLAPLFVLVVLLLFKDHPWFARVLGALATISVLSWCLTLW